MAGFRKSTREILIWVILLSGLPLCANQLAPLTSPATSALIMWFVYAAIAWVLGSRVIALALLGSALAPFLLEAPTGYRNVERVLLQSLQMMVAGAVGGALLGIILEPGDADELDATQGQVLPIEQERESIGF